MGTVARNRRSVSAMLQSHQIDDLLTLVSVLDRPALTDQFHHYQASFPVDFTDQCLTDLPLDRLRHIYVAVCLQTQRMPHDPTPAAACFSLGADREVSSPGMSDAPAQPIHLAYGQQAPFYRRRKAIFLALLLVSLLVGVIA